MALSKIIGAVIASEALSTAAMAIAAGISEAHKNAQNNQAQEIAPVIQKSVVEPVVEPVAPPNYAFCDYCDGLISLDKGYSVCPHCGAPIARNTKFVAHSAQPAQNVQLAQNVQPQKVTPIYRSGYYVDCDNCNTNIRYVQSDILRSPSANKAVKARGFRGHTGEVKCPRCGTFLPHYESNWK